MFADVGDIRIRYEMAGAGPPLVLVHGIGADALVWEGMLSALGERFSVYALDLRGFGQTIRPAQSRLSYPLWVEDVRRFVETLGLRSASFVGWSLGATILLNLALRDTAMVRHLVLIGAPSPSRPPSDRSGFNERLRLAQAGASIEEIVEKTFYFSEQAFSPHTLEHNPLAVEKMRQTLLRNDPASYAEMVEANRTRTDIADRIQTIACPTLLIVGDSDARTPVAMSEDLNRSIGPSYLKILPRCGHFYSFEQPEATANHILRFLAAFSLRSQ